MLHIKLKFSWPAFIWACALLLIAGNLAIAAENHDTHQNHKKENIPQMGGAKNLPLLVRVLPTPPTQEEVERQEKEANNKTIADSLMVAFTGLIALIGLFQLAVFIKQYSVFKEQAGFLRDTVEEMRVARETAKEIAENQFHSTKESLEISKIAADAAALSAKAAIGVELPFLNIESITSNIDYEKGAEEWETFVPMITVKNYGRTPAFISNIIVNLRVEGALPSIPEYKQSDKYYFGPAVVDKDASYVHKEFSFHKAGIFSEEAVDKIKKSNMLLYGVIYFKDFLGNDHEKRFIFLYAYVVKEFFIPSAYPEYKYQK